MKTSASLILSRTDIARAMSLQDYIAAVESAFALAANSRMDVPPVVHMAAPDGGFHVKSAAYIGDPHYVAVKVNGNFPGNPRRNGLPTIQGALLLSDARNGALLAIMDSTEVTAMRTGAATAVAAKYLARKDANTVTVVGCGVQGRLQLLALLEVLPLRQAFVFDTNRERAEQFASALRAETGRAVSVANDLAAATRKSDVIVTSTTARDAFLGMEHVVPGTFIAAIGADNPEKQELQPSLMAIARVVVDQLEQCATMGDLHHAIKAGAMSRQDVAAEMGAVVAGHAHLQLRSQDIVVFDSTGTAIQDVAAAGVIYERSVAAGIGHRLALF